MFRYQLFIGAAVSLAALGLGTQQAAAADPNNPQRAIKKIWNFECIAEGWEIKIREFETGQDSVSFKGTQRITRTLHGDSLPAWFERDPYYPTGTFGAPPEVEFGEVTFDVAEANGGRICADNGGIIGYGSKYTILRARNTNPWKNTQIDWIGDVGNLIELNAGDIMERYRSKLARQPNAGPLPPRTTCPTSRNACFSGTVPELGPGMGVDGLRRTTMTTPDLTFMSGQDIHHMMRGPKWGTRKSDLEGLSINMAETLANLGIINRAAIIDEIRGVNNTTADGGRFIFRKLESDYHPTMMVIEDDDEELQLIVRPALNPTGERGVSRNGTSSWPTNQHVDQSEEPFWGGPGRTTPNPNYCPQNDPRSDDYIPQYLHDSAAMLELWEDYAYLTGDQEDRIEQMGWAIGLVAWNWTHEQWAQTIMQNPNMRRRQYDCVLADPLSNQVSSVRYSEGNETGCKTKDVAYYDALIDKLVVVNPSLDGNVQNHPCNRPRVVGTVGSVLKTPMMKPPVMKRPVMKREELKAMETAPVQDGPRRRATTSD